MATVHVGANADPHPSIILVPPEGWPVPTEGRRASSTSTSSSGASAPFVPRGRTHCKPGRGWSGGWLARKDSNLQSLLIQSQVPCRLATRHRGPKASKSLDRAAAHLNDPVPAPWPTCP